MDNNNDQIQYLWDIYNYITFNKHARKVLEEVKKDPNKRNQTVGIITGLNLDGYGNSTKLEIPADALLRIWQFNYNRIQESLNEK